MLARIECPYCGESFDSSIEPADGNQDYIEDCQVCCRPIEVHIEADMDGEFARLTVRRDDD